MCIKQKRDLKKTKNYDILITLVDFYASLSRFFCYPDPGQRFLKWIRILPNEGDPGGSGSGTLIKIKNPYYLLVYPRGTGGFDCAHQADGTGGGQQN